MKLGTTLMSLWMNFRQVMGATGPPPSTLLNDLVSYWPLNEVSGTRYDVVGSNDLTDNNTVGAVLRGPEGTVANYTRANSEDLSRASFVMPEVFSYLVWINADSPPTNNYETQYGMGFRTSGVLGSDFFEFGVNATTYPHWVGIGGYIGDQFFNTYIDGYNDTGGVIGNRWILLCCDHDGSSLHYRVIGSASSQDNTELGPVAASLWAGATGKLELGGARDGSVGLFDGKMGPSAIWSRVLSNEERLAVFAQGNGLRYAELSDDLKTGLVSWWELDEVSGVRYDSHGSNDLTDNNTVGSVNSGPKGVVSLHDGNNNEYFSTAWTPTAAWSVVGWVKQTIEQISTVAEWGSVWPNTVNGLQINNSGGGNLSIRGWQSDGSNYALANVAKVGALNTWRMASARYDGAKIRAQIDTDAYAEDVADGSSATGAGNLYIGSGVMSGQAAFYGNFAGIGVWSRSLSDAELISLFNGGIGKRYADLTDGEKVGLVSYWNLDEASGVRYDSHGSNDLTDNNTVGSVINAGDAMDGAAASFVAANSESLSTVALSGFSDISISAWFKTPASPSNYQGVFQLGEGDYAAGTTLIAAYLDANNTFAIENFNNDGVQKLYKTYATLPSSTWHFVYAEYDAASGVVSCSLDNSALTAGTAQGAAGPNALDRLLLGTLGGSNYFGSQIDEVAIWSRALTADERAELYALGRGRYYDFS